MHRGAATGFTEPIQLPEEQDGEGEQETSRSGVHVWESWGEGGGVEGGGGGGVVRGSCPGALLPQPPPGALLLLPLPGLPPSLDLTPFLSS